MIDDAWWIFSEHQPPRSLTGNLHPWHARDLKAPWAYDCKANKWYWFDEYARNWTGRWSSVQDPKNIPKDYLIQLLLVKP